MKNEYKRYSVGIEHGVYDLVAEDNTLKNVSGEVGDPVLVRTYDHKDNLLLVQRDVPSEKDIVKIQGPHVKRVESKLSKITGLNLSNFQD